MGHRIQGFIANPSLLAGISDAYGLGAAAPLSRGLAFLPFGPELHDAIFPSSPASDEAAAIGFAYLSRPLLEVLRTHSSAGDIAYIESDYFGGVGRQSAITMRRRNIVQHESATYHGPINAALHALGVRAMWTGDAFDAVGLSRYRNNESARDVSVSLADGVRLSLPPDQLSELEQRYEEPPRAYHNFTHVEDVLRQYRLVARNVGWHDPATVYLAVLYHDAIYEAGRGDNEDRSADLAVAEIARWQPHASIDAARVAELIRLTAHHGQLDRDALDHDACLFLDCDMAILGAPSAAFEHYSDAIAEEYRDVVPPAEFSAGRRHFLTSLLARDRIYLSDHFHARLDAPARANLKRAIAAV